MPALPLVALLLVLPALVALGARLGLSWSHVEVDEALTYPDGSRDLVTAMAWGTGSDSHLFAGLRSGRVLGVDRSGASAVVIEQGEFDATDSGAVAAPVLSLDFSSGDTPHALVQARDPNSPDRPVAYSSDMIEAADGLFASVEANGGSAVAGFRPDRAFEAQQAPPSAIPPLGLRLYRDIARGSDIGPTEVGEIFGIDDVRVVAALPGTSTVIAGTGDGGVHAIDASEQISGTSPETYQRRIGDHIRTAPGFQASIPGSESAVVGIAVASAPDPSRVLFATLGQDNSIRVWRGSVSRASELIPLGDYQSIEVSAIGSRWEASSINPLLFGGPGVNEAAVSDLLSISADGRRVLVAVAELDLRILEVPAVDDPASSTAYSSISDGRYGAPAILSPDGSRLLAVNRVDNTVELLDLTAVETPARPLPVLATFDALRGRGVSSFQFDASGRRFVAVGRDRMAYVYDMESPGEPVTIETPQGMPIASAISPDGSLIALGMAQGSVVVADAQAGQIVAVLRENVQPPVSALSFSPSGKTLHSIVSAFGTIETYSLRRQAVMVETNLPVALEGSISAFTDNGARHVSIGGGELRILDLETRRDLTEPIQWNFSLNALRASDDARVIAILDDEGRLQILREYPDPERDGQPPLVAEGGLLLSADGLTLVVRDRSGYLHHASLEQGKAPVAKLVKLDWPTPAMQVALSPDGSEIAIAGRDGTVTIASAARLLPAGTDGASGDASAADDLVVTGHGAPLSAMAISPDGAFLATASIDGRLRLTRIDAARFVRSLPFASLPSGPSAIPPMSPSIVLGSDLVVKIQEGLRAFGHDDLQPDGIVGVRTRSAILEFQQLFALPATGVPNLDVYRKMIEIGLIEADTQALPNPPPAAN